MLYLKLLGAFLIILGAITSAISKTLVKKYRLDLKATCDFESELNTQELDEYRYNKALVNLKMIGMTILLPGVLIILYVYS